MKIHINDLPHDFKDATIVAIDTETMGLNIFKDKLCTVQLNIKFNEKQEIHIVHFPKKEYNLAINLKKFLRNKKVLKIIHFARFDMLSIYLYLNVMLDNVVCTKMLSKIVRSYSDRHSLVESCRELLNINLNKQSQSSDWGQLILSEQQFAYAANDVKYLFDIYEQLKNMAIREKRIKIAESAFKTLQSLTYIESQQYHPLDILSFDLKSHKY